VRTLAARLAVAVASLTLSVGAIELGFWLAGYDFDQVAPKWKSRPIYYRQPTVETGEVFFRRAGPASWRGQVLFEEALRAGVVDSGYATELVVTARYDAEGFRNPADLSDWDVAVVGDSFTEAGYLAEEELFSSELARATGLRVRNLGVSHTGVLSHAHYLERYGAAASTRHAVLMFFEGNDIADTVREQALLAEFRATGERPRRDLRAKEQHSFVRALRNLVRGAGLRRAERAVDVIDGHFESAAGRVPVTLAYTPRARGDVSDEEWDVLREALTAFARAARETGQTPWLVFLPCKRRVLSGRLAGEAPTRADEADLPDAIGRLADEVGVRFVDTTAPLRERSRRGVLTYNAIWDTHLNAEGHRVVGLTLADALSRGRGGTDAVP